MILRKQKNQTVEVLHDLVNIHKDRIACYQQTINQSKLDADLKKVFAKIILEGEEYKQQLVEKIKELDNGSNIGSTILGKIYNAWSDLKVTVTCSTRKSVISYCLYNEDVADYAYNAALNHYSKTDKEIAQLLETQHEALQKTHSLIKNCHEAQHSFFNPRLAYYN